MRRVEIETEFIKLDSLLKIADFVSSGGEAKILITSGDVTVNGDIELRRGRKLRHNDVISFNGDSVIIEGKA